jgi:hypothetical protein
MRYSHDESEFDRAIAFVDGTFAVALTLLITTLDIEDRASSFASLRLASGPQLWRLNTLGRLRLVDDGLPISFSEAKATISAELD